MCKNVIKASSANIHTDDMQRFYGDLIKASVESTRIFDNLAEFEIGDNKKTTFSLWQTDSVSAIFQYKKGRKNNRVCVLNYASFKNPGGGFLNGAFAQEETLCHESDLYNVISTFDDFYKWNNSNLNKGLYSDRALYSPEIMFIRDSSDEADKADVLTCAAPNWSAARRNGVTREQNNKALENRIRFIRSIVETMKPDAFIAGAYGCGVFRQDPQKVCELFLDAFRTSNVKNIIFAIPKGPNYDAFEGVMEQHKPEVK